MDQNVFLNIILVQNIHITSSLVLFLNATEEDVLILILETSLMCCWLDVMKHLLENFSS